MQRLAGRQTRTLMIVPASHLDPEPLPTKDVHNCLQEIRQQQYKYYNRFSRDLPPLPPRQDIRSRRATPASVPGLRLLFFDQRRHQDPRFCKLKTAGKSKHLSAVAPQLEARPSTSATSQVEDVERLAQEVRWSAKKRHEQCRYSQPEKKNLPRFIIP